MHIRARGRISAMRIRSLLPLLLAPLALLASCGGDEDPTDRYLGRWDRVTLKIGQASRQELFAVAGGRLLSSYPPGAVTGIGGDAEGVPVTFDVFTMARP